MAVQKRMQTTENSIKVADKMKKQKRKSKGVVSGTAEISEDIKNNELKLTEEVQNADLPKVSKKSKPTEGIQKYPILNDEQLVQKFRSVPITNNQKGRIRQLLRDSLKGTSESLLPEVIHNRIKAIMKSTDNLTDSDLRKIRILHNMLKTSVQTDNSKSEKVTVKDESSKKVLKKNKKQKELINIEMKKEVDTNLEEEGGKKNPKAEVTKIKGPKRYVVFVGNLPLDVDEEKIMQHFSEFKDSIKDVRLPKQIEGKKSTIAFVELENEIAFELALSKHHSMLGNKRINVLYTAQKKGKISKTEAKSKTAKLVAMQKSGKLIGSVPMNKKRSHRRMKMKQAQAKLAAEAS